ncbi:MAG: alkaline phosphatase D family protein, partial [Myxococcales bacterium]|nr:alkaline phosphatase D family protein [Myxococcales bacterium]
FRWGDTVELVLLDCRYELVDEPELLLVGEAQMAWLLERLRTSPCRFVCVCTDKPFADVRMADGDPYPSAGERWAGRPASRDRVTQLLDDEGLTHVLFVTGDIHMNYVGRVSEAGDRTSDRAWEICCTSGNVNPLVRDLSLTQFDWTGMPPHVPRLTFDPDAGTVTVAFHAADGTVSHEQVLTLPARG